MCGRAVEEVDGGEELKRNYISVSKSSMEGNIMQNVEA